MQSARLRLLRGSPADENPVLFTAIMGTAELVARMARLDLLERHFALQLFIEPAELSEGAREKQRDARLASVDSDDEQELGVNFSVVAGKNSVNPS